MPIVEPDDKEKIKILKISLAELRRFYDHVSNIYDQLRVKSLALIAGEVAIVTFIFSDSTAREIPDSAALRTFFFAGILFLILAFSLLLWTISSFPWQISHDLEDSQKLYKKYEAEKDFLEYLHDDFIGAIGECLPRVEKKSKRFNWTIYLLAAGVIILLVIKYGGSPHDIINRHH
ncbi:MAG TPA: hypothetical protein VJR27_02730 [Candidatus Saccharimonadales bacterium]|nr:hypothetical protein [Candidatus Saccharimonadales bacterium]